MGAAYFYLCGWAAFTGGTAVLGYQLRQRPTVQQAERSSRFMHFLFFAGLNLPGIVAFFNPGYLRLDSLVGLPSLAPRSLFLVIGLLLAIPGIYFMIAPNLLLRKLGRGANAFRLTHNVVDSGVYGLTRNPMSLGYYLCALSISLVVGSSAAALVTLFTLIPSHLFFLKYFEEHELCLRFGDAYQSYREQVPFLIPRLPFF